MEEVTERGDAVRDLAGEEVAGQIEALEGGEGAEGGDEATGEGVAGEGEVAEGEDGG